MLTVVNLFSIYVLVQRLLNYYPSYSTRRLYFGEVETPYKLTTRYPWAAIPTQLPRGNRGRFATRKLCVITDIYDLS